MMNNMLRVLWLSCIMILNVSTILASEYLLISTQEEAMVSLPCRFYHLKTTPPSLSLVAEISPQQGIRLVADYQQERKLAIWRYEENQSGSLVIVDVDMPEDVRTIPLPFKPILGGYLMKGTEGEPLFIAWDASNSKDRLYAYSVMSDHFQPIQTAQWETASIHGINELRGKGGNLLNVKINPKNGEIAYYSGDFRTPLSFRFDEATLQIFNHVETRATMVWANNEKICALGAQEKGNNREHFLIFIYDKIRERWDYMIVEGVYSLIQYFDNWMLIQQALEDQENRHGPSILTGKYTFYHIDSHEQFVWQADPNAEVLGIWGNTMLYRIENKLFEADIVESDVINSRFLYEDPDIQNVHWSFIMK